ncbi:hypothetical protein BOTBODRAFT_310623 [Botryobasidium botryosum FD-172 SS1]|uniref:Uncharacterized protein n=1 Tax=Botryobasidium botryosum (strain FD-172 SS1) TaxID=930990 RepID=A0A067N8S0_BOTB1|nr:hypothetical protein BOTBODRAFT_310623 [Botryobasidium botryosum FD-172 SS1]
MQKQVRQKIIMKAHALICGFRDYYELSRSYTTSYRSIEVHLASEDALITSAESAEPAEPSPRVYIYAFRLQGSGVSILPPLQVTRIFDNFARGAPTRGLRGERGVERLMPPCTAEPATWKVVPRHGVTWHQAEWALSLCTPSVSAPRGSRASLSSFAQSRGACSPVTEVRGCAKSVSFSTGGQRAVISAESCHHTQQPGSHTTRKEQRKLKISILWWQSHLDSHKLFMYPRRDLRVCPQY